MAKGMSSTLPIILEAGKSRLLLANKLDKIWEVPIIKKKTSETCLSVLNVSVDTMIFSSMFTVN